MTITKLRPTFTFDQDRLDALRALAPEAFADGKINREALLEALGEHLEDEGRDAEHFGLFWPGKRDARRLASLPSAGALRPAPGEGVNEATTRHLFIEGDNLEVLKLLQKSYAGRVKMIYIDPPYNTGNDFIYSDNFTQPMEEYLRATGQADEMGRVLVTNTQAGGRYHSNWLNMMYPRLRLARNLLRDDGVIFVSIDDHEVHNLRVLMNEVFGEESFIACIVWKRRQVADNRNVNQVSTDHEYVMAFGRISTVFLGVAKDLTKYSNPDSDPRGPWMSDNVTGLANRDERPNLHYDLVNPETGIMYPPHPTRGWIYEPRTMARLITEGRILWPSNPEGRPRLKRFLNEIRSTFTGFSSVQDVGHTTDGTREFVELFGEKLLAFPKPVSLLKLLCQQATGSSGGETVLDFFSGSGTMAQAVLEINQEDDGDRRFIMVQLPEPIETAEFPTIADIGKERIRRVIKRMQAEDAGKLTTGRDGPEDLGFRVFKLDRSSYKAWRDFEGGDVAELQTLFDRFESPLVEGWQAEDVLVEVMLMEGFPLDSATEPLPEFTRNTVTRVSSDLVVHRLFVCLDAAVHEETITALGSSAGLALGEEDIFICLDSALTDEAKVRLEDGRRVKVI